MADFAHGKASSPLIILHGGAGAEDQHSPSEVLSETLVEVAEQALLHLRDGLDPLEVVTFCLRALERNERFNAGRGSVIQADGQVRVTAALMDGSAQCFSGVINATSVLHPSELARHLQGADARVLSFPGVDLLARQHAVAPADLYTSKRLNDWLQRVQPQTGEPTLSQADTVGCVLLTGEQKLYAGTSTGGRSGVLPGRVSDAATVAGTYASAYAAISTTGEGEQIVDDGVACRLETRVRDGLTLADAAHRSYAEAQSRQRHYGWIALTCEGEWNIAYTTSKMSFAVLSTSGVLSVPK